MANVNNGREEGERKRERKREREKGDTGKDIQGEYRRRKEGKKGKELSTHN